MLFILVVEYCWWREIIVKCGRNNGSHRSCNRCGRNNAPAPERETTAGAFSKSELSINFGYVHEGQRTLAKACVNAGSHIC